MGDKIYIKLIPNEKRTAPNQPSYVAPPNLKRPDKNWTIGVEINGKWYSQAGFDELAENGEPTGGLTICLTPNEKSPSQGSTGGGTPKFAYKKPYAKPGSYAK
tara:strand:- start:1631 stop:1939 length:309 start_codon:yes stop_codon:yes gene_type:complete